MIKKHFFRKLWAFTKIDLLNDVSYKLAFVFEIANVLASCMIFFFISKIFGDNNNPYLKPYGGNYFSFVILGIAFSNYLITAMSSFSGTIVSKQQTGTLEAILATPTHLFTVIIGGSIWSFLHATFRVLLYLILGALFFDLNLSQSDPVSVLLILVLTVIAFSGLGAISSGFVLIFKKASPITVAFRGFSRILGGVFFPIAILPLWLQKIAHFLPITYSLDAMRLAILKGVSVEALLPQIAMLSLFCVISVPLGIISLNLAVKKTKKDGSLTHL